MLGTSCLGPLTLDVARAQLRAGRKRLERPGCSKGSLGWAASTFHSLLTQGASSQGGENLQKATSTFSRTRENKHRMLRGGNPTLREDEGAPEAVGPDCTKSRHSWEEIYFETVCFIKIQLVINQ